MSEDQGVEPSVAGQVDLPATRMTALNSVSLISALLTIFTFLKDAAEVADFMLRHVGLSMAVLAALLLLFSGDLAPRFARHLSRLIAKIWGFFFVAWRKLLPAGSKLPGRKIFSFGRATTVAVALFLVVFSVFQVYVSGVYYILLESSTNENAVSLRAAELNAKLEARGSGLRVQVTPPLGRNEYFGITMGPIFDHSQAVSSLRKLRQVIPVREDAEVIKVTAHNMWRRVAGAFG